MHGPLRCEVPFVLRVGGEAQRAGGEVVTRDVGLAVLLAPAVVLELGAGHQRVVVGQQGGELGAERGVGVAGAVDVVEVARLGARGRGVVVAQSALRPAAPAALAEATLDFEPAEAFQAAVELPVQAQQRVVAGVVAAAGVVGLLGQRAGEGAVIGDAQAAPAVGLVVDQQGHQHERRALVASPLQPARRMQAGAPVGRLRGLHGLAVAARHRRAVVAHGGGRAVGVALAVVGREREVVDQVVDAVVARPGEAGVHVPVFHAEAHPQVVEPLLEAFARDDVDGARDGPCTGLGGGRAQDLDALDLLGRERVDREARRHPLAVDEDLRVATAKPPHADRPAPPRRALQRDARQALQDLAHRAVAETLDLLAPDHDLGGGGLAALALVVVARAGDLDALELLRRRRRRGRRWRLCLRGGRGHGEGDQGEGAVGSVKTVGRHGEAATGKTLKHARDARPSHR